MKRVLIVDDLPDARELMGSIVRASFPDAELHFADSCETGLRAIDGGPWDLALVDLSLGDGDGTQLVGELHRRQPRCLCVICSIHNDDRRVFEAMRAGADGYLLKDQPQAVTVRQLLSIADGLPPLSPPIARRLIAHFQGTEGQPPDSSLTPREREVLAKLAQGMTLADIAGEFHLSRHTVSDHVKNIYRKLGISSRAEAALRARSMGLT